MRWISQDLSIPFLSHRRHGPCRFLSSTPLFGGPRFLHGARNLFLTFPRGPELKVEFTFYPGSPLEPRRRVEGILVDSLLDIAVNKAFTIAQNARTRDFIDLHLILKREKWTFQDLLKKARAKFDVYVDPVQIGSQLMKVSDFKDYPRMILKIRDRDWQDFFLKEAKKIKVHTLKP